MNMKLVEVFFVVWQMILWVLWIVGCGFCGLGLFHCISGMLRQILKFGCFISALGCLSCLHMSYFTAGQPGLID